MLTFTKMQGIGNDYVYIDCTKEQKIVNIPKVVKKISDRHYGIGSDGLILIYPSNYADFRMRMFNSDGTEAQMCGNGIRCLGKFVYDKGLTNKTTITVETLSGIKILKLNKKDNQIETVLVDMGMPIFKPSMIPVLAKDYPIKNLKIQAKDKIFNFVCVSMGNPHAVTIVEDTTKLDISTYGRMIEEDFHFPQKTNVEFVQILDKENIQLRVWERGSKETLACGTGACAAVVACCLKRLTKNVVNVNLRGGTLNIQWCKENNHIYMTGPATTVYEGKIEEDKLNG